MAVTGVGASLNSTDAQVKFSATEAWKITRIGGLARSVIVIDDSHLGLTQGNPKQYCYGDLVDLSPISIDVQVDPDSTTVFEAGTVAGGNASDTPIPLGEVTSGGAEMILTLSKKTSSTAATLTMTGAFISDSGIELANNDRLRATFQFMPDGKTFSWAAPT